MLELGQKYLLNIPPYMVELDTGSPGWQHQLVTLQEVFDNTCIDADSVCDCDDCRVGPYKAFVTCPGLRTEWEDNHYRAVPEWLVSPSVALETIEKYNAQIDELHLLIQAIPDDAWAIVLTKLSFGNTREKMAQIKKKYQRLEEVKSK